MCTPENIDAQSAKCLPFNLGDAPDLTGGPADGYPQNCSVNDCPFIQERCIGAKGIGNTDQPDFPAANVCSEGCYNGFVEDKFKPNPTGRGWTPCTFGLPNEYVKQWPQPINDSSRSNIPSLEGGSLVSKVGFNAPTLDPRPAARIGNSWRTSF